MVGRGVLRECLLDPDVETVLAIVRSSSLPQHDKLREIVQHDLSDLSAIEARLSGYDACFFCLGVSAVGMNEEAYRRLTYDLTVSVARTLGKLNPTMTFIYVSGAGTDSTERGRIMWAGERQNGKRTVADALQGCVPVSPGLHSASSRHSHEDSMVWRSLRASEKTLSAIEALPELRDNNRVRGSRNVEGNQAWFPQTCP